MVIHAALVPYFQEGIATTHQPRLDAIHVRARDLDPSRLPRIEAFRGSPKQKRLISAFAFVLGIEVNPRRFDTRLMVIVRDFVPRLIISVLWK